MARQTQKRLGVGAWALKHTLPQATHTYPSPQTKPAGREGATQLQQRAITLPSRLGSMPGFVLPPVEENAEGWGPTTVPEQFDGVPFMPYSKGERLGRIADFGQQAGRGMFQGEAGA